MDRFWGELGRSDLYNKRYSFEQNHKMLNPNHLRNVQPHRFELKIQKSKIRNFNLKQSKMSSKRAFKKYEKCRRVKYREKECVFDIKNHPFRLNNTTLFK